MLCPSCGSRVDDGVWLCPFCEHILDPSVLGVDDDDEPPVRAERTKIVSFIPGPSEPAPEAMILGDVDVSASEFSVVQGPGAQPNGRTSTFLFYTSGATSRIMHPDAVPERTHRDASVPRTPYEDFILACIDGKRSVRAIQRASGLAPQEVVITLLTLLDKGVIHIEPTARPTSSVEPASAEPPPSGEPTSYAEPTATDEDGDARGTEELDTGDVDQEEPPDFGAESEATIDAFSALAREEARGRASGREVDDEPRDEPATDDGAGIDDEAFEEDELGAGDALEDASPGAERDDLDLGDDDAGYADQDDEDEGEVLRRAREDSVEADLGRAGDDEGVTGEIELAELQKLSKAPAEAATTDDLPEEDLLSKPLEKSDRLAPKPLLPRRRKTSAARRWGAPAPSAMPLDADELVEREDEPPVMPQALDEGDSEMITDHSSPLRAKPSARPLPKASTVRPRPPSLPTREVDKNDPRPSRVERPLHEEPKRDTPKREEPRRETPKREEPQRREEPRAARAATPRPDRTPPPRIRNATGEPPSAMLREPTRPPEIPRGKSTKLATTPPPVLDPEFLLEVPKSIVVPRPEALERDTPPPSKIERASSLDGLLPPLVEPQPMDAPPGEDDDDELPAAPISAFPELARGEDKRRVLEQAMKRGPIEERDRRKPAGADLGRKRKSDEPEEPPVVEPRAVEPRSEKKLEAIARVPPAQRPAPGPAVSGVNIAPAISVAPVAKAPAPDRPSRDAKPAPSHVDVVRMAKAQKLFDEALKDKADGNLVSARMNMKLALTFDPTNELYQQAFEELSKAAGGGGGGGGPGIHRSKARELYDQATRAEEVGDVDEAIALLEKALGESKEAAFYNRLGVILAMKKKEFARAQQLIETALELAPGNATYQHNLRKVLSMAAAEDVVNRQSGGKKGGLLGFLGRKK